MFSCFHLFCINFFAIHQNNNYWFSPENDAQEQQPGTLLAAELVRRNICIHHKPAYFAITV